MTDELAVPNNTEIIERLISQGDLSKLSPEERTNYYVATCKSLGLNPLTRPFEYISMKGKLTLYAKRDCTDQLRRIYGVSISIIDRQEVGDCYIVTAKATTPDNRSDESTGVVPITKLTGDNLANALMKAETKAKRRVTLSIVGLGWLDETETETIPNIHYGEPTPPRWSLEEEAELKQRVIALNDKGLSHEQILKELEEEGENLKIGDVLGFLT